MHGDRVKVFNDRGTTLIAVNVSENIMHALAVGPIAELRANYGDGRQAEGFAYEKSVAPNITLKPKVDKLGLPILKIWVSPMSSGSTA